MSAFRIINSNSPVYFLFAFLLISAVVLMIMSYYHLVSRPRVSRPITTFEIAIQAIIAFVTAYYNGIYREFKGRAGFDRTQSRFEINFLGSGIENQNKK